MPRSFAMQGITRECLAVPASTSLTPIEPALRSRGIRVHYTTWMRLVRAKGLPARKIGGRYYVDLHDLDDWLTAQRVEAARSPASKASPRAMAAASAQAVLAARRRGRGGHGHRSSGGSA